MASATTSLKLSSETKERIDRLAESKERSAHWVMKRAIEEYVEREEKREQFRKDADEAWEEYQLTGLHVTFDEVDQWLAKLARGEKARPPKLHK
jgi:predicted transcriptional regulator